MAGFALGQLRIPGGRVVFVLFLLGLTLPFEGVIMPLYYEIRELGLLNTRWAIILPLIGLFMPFAVFWMRAHFVNMPRGALRGGAGRRRDDLAAVLAGPRSARSAGRSSSLAILMTVWTWNQFLLAIVLVDDPDQAHDGGRARRLPGPVGHGHPAPVGRVAAHPDADDHRLRHLPAPVRLGAAAGIAEGLGRDRRAAHIRRPAQCCFDVAQ